LCLPLRASCGFICTAHPTQPLSPSPHAATVDGAFTAPSNEAFDASLRQRDAAWGIRDIADCEAVARSVGLTLLERVPMPANNFLLVWEKV
jgi:hypothetical protein